MKRFLLGLNKNFERYICVALMFWVIAWDFYAVISRYVFKQFYWPGSEELARYSYIFMIFLGAAYVTLDEGHLSVDILRGIIGPEKGKYLTVLWNVVGCAIYAYMLPSAYKIYTTSVKMHKAYPATQIQQSIFLSVLVILCVLGIIRSIQVVIRNIRLISQQRKEGAAQ